MIVPVSILTDMVAAVGFEPTPPKRLVASVVLNPNVYGLWEGNP